jgi:glycosyl transferase family 2
MIRPTVDVVIPFAGSASALAVVAARLAALELGPGDSAVIADNRAEPEPVDVAVRVVAAPAQRSSYYARNRGAEAGRAEWLLFLDADVQFDPDLIDRLFDPPPGERVGVLAGAIEDVVVDEGAVARRQRSQRAMSQHHTLAGPHPYAQTAHCAVRRSAFEAAGGFTEGIRSGGDADLCFRLAAAGWAIEPRAASVRHEARGRLRARLAQLARHGAGAAWLEARYPGSFPEPAHPARLVWWLARSLPPAVLARLRGERERATEVLMDPLAALAFAVGRRRSNAAGTGKRSAGTHGS